jgi:hypothetical protein
VNAVRSESNLANGIADESLQRKVFGNAIHNGAKPPNILIHPNLPAKDKVAAWSESG